jgi:hypothetical protein
MDYLRRKAANTLVSASGGRANGYGRIELFVAGKLLYVLAYYGDLTRAAVFHTGMRARKMYLIVGESY